MKSYASYRADAKQLAWGPVSEKRISTNHTFLANSGGVLSSINESYWEPEVECQEKSPLEWKLLVEATSEVVRGTDNCT